MQKIIIGLVGPMASGKEVTKKYLESKYGAKSCKFSTIVRDVLDRVFVEKSRENLSAISTALRGLFGDDLFSRVIAQDTQNLDSNVVVVDGVRRLTDVSHLTALPNFYLISIDADPQVRFKRMVLRNENRGDAEKTFEQFMEEHNLETELQIPEVMKSAKFTIDNTEDSFEALYKKIDEVMGKIKPQLEL